jgi:hypothetical protein
MWAETYTRPGTGAPASNYVEEPVAFVLYMIGYAEIHVDWGKYR